MSTVKQIILITAAIKAPAAIKDGLSSLFATNTHLMPPIAVEHRPSIVEIVALVQDIYLYSLSLS